MKYGVDEDGSFRTLFGKTKNAGSKILEGKFAGFTVDNIGEDYGR